MIASARNFGVLLFGVGFALVIAAFASAAAHGHWQVWVRGSFQHADDYTGQGWRAYRLGVTLAALGMMLLVMAVAFA